MKRIITLGLFLVIMMVMVSPVSAKGGSFGVGWGLPYGIMGGNLDYNILSNFDLSIGLGVSPLSGFSFNLGGKLYLRSEEENFRPRVSCYYGTNTMVDETGYFDLEDDYKNYNGVTAGIGFSVYFGSLGRRGLEVDLLYRVSTEADIDGLEAQGYDTEGIEKVTMSIGYRQKF